MKDGARSVRGDTLLLVDPTEIRKEFSYKMEFVTRVRDASRSSKEGRDVLVNGYHGCMVAACRPGGRKTVPLVLKQSPSWDFGAGPISLASPSPSQSRGSMRA